MMRKELEIFFGETLKFKHIVEYISCAPDPPEVQKFADFEILDFHESGFSVYLNDEKNISTIFFFGVSNDFHSSYKGPLPFNITFKYNKEEISNLFGVPSSSGFNQSTAKFWERFDLEKFSIHIEYLDDFIGIGMITIMSPAMAKGNV